MASSINASTSGAGGVITTADNTGILQLQSASTTVATINAFGIGLGTGVPSSGTGITFPATKNPSSNANTLDDYEEGTFTPSFTFSTSGSVTYGQRTAHYTKIGRMVNCTIALVLSGVSSPSGTMTITGLPFTAGSGEAFVSGITVGIARNFTSVLTITGYVGQSSNEINLAKNAENASFNPLTGSDLTSSTGFYITITYATA
jgi:hypothetical protein